MALKGGSLPLVSDAGRPAFCAIPPSTRLTIGSGARCPGKPLMVHITTNAPSRLGVFAPRTVGVGRVEVWRGGVRSSMSVSAPWGTGQSDPIPDVPSGAEEIGEVGEGRPHGIDDGAACDDLGSMFQQITATVLTTASLSPVFSVVSSPFHPCRPCRRPAWRAPPSSVCQ